MPQPRSRSLLRSDEVWAHWLLTASRLGLPSGEMADLDTLVGVGHPAPFDSREARLLIDQLVARARCLSARYQVGRLPGGALVLVHDPTGARDNLHEALWLFRQQADEDRREVVVADVERGRAEGVSFHRLATRWRVSPRTLYRWCAKDTPSVSLDSRDIGAMVGSWQPSTRRPRPGAPIR